MNLKDVELTPEKREALNEFKERLSDVLDLTQNDDYSLLKWLIARRYNVTKAETMFRQSLAFKERMKASLLINDYTSPEVLQKYFASGMCGYDKEGSPVAVELFGHLDMRGLMMSAKKSDFEKTKLRQCELIVNTCRERTQQFGRRVDGITVIFDMENVGTKTIWRPGLQLYLHMVKVLEDNYPEMMKRMFVINAPSIFPLLYKVCRPLVSEDMRRKIHVVQSSDIQRVLLTYIDADQLPAFLGGTLTDPDGNPRCPSKICPGGEVPRSYYLAESNNSYDMDTAVVPHGECVKLDYHVTVINSVLRWEFRTEDYDIAFGVTYTPLTAANDISESGRDASDSGHNASESSHDAARDVIVPVRRVDSHVMTQDDSVVCDRLGTYSVVFDNTSSWTKTKKLQYHIELYSTDDATEHEVQALTAKISETTHL